MATDTYTASDGESLDWICWRHYGRQAIAFEEVLDANQGLAAKGVFLQAGDTVSLPAISAPVLPIIKIWE